MKKLVIVLILLCVSATPLFAQEEFKPGAFPAWSTGRTDAPITIEVFNSFSCPPCVTSNKVLIAILEKYPSDVRVIYRQYPLKGEGHENSRAAAQAREAAGQQGKFFEMSAILLDKQDTWKAKKSALDEFITYAKTLEIDIELFKQDYESALTRQRINQDIERGISFKLNGTPSIVFNGKLLSNAQTVSVEALEEKIHETRKITKQ
jgi:protein-disulfide isomerase